MLSFGRALALTALVATARAGGDDHADHAEETHSFEWAGIFETPDDVYFWNAEKATEGDYADPAMTIALFSAPAATEKDLHALEEAGDAEIAKERSLCTNVTAHDGYATPADNAVQVLRPASGVCYNLMFDPNSHSSVFKIDATGVPNIAFFAEHVPTEFERNSHYLKDIEGEDIEPAAELPEEEEVKKPWALVILASLITNIVTLVGIVFLTPFFAALKEAHPKAIGAVINAFACGALLAAAFYLMLYEATHLIKPEGSSESGQIAYWGSAALVGFMVPYLIDVASSALFKPQAPVVTPAAEKAGDVELAGVDQGKVVADPLSDPAATASAAATATEESAPAAEESAPAAEESAPAAEESAGDVELAAVDQDKDVADPAVTPAAEEARDVELAAVDQNKVVAEPVPGPAASTSAAVTVTDPGRAVRVRAGILLGDFMHNLVDGFFIGFGFMMCDSAFGWKITAATVAHEIAQELADYLVLTDPAQGNLAPKTALLLNFFSGTSVILGAIIILAQGTEDNVSLGMLLAFGGGIYLQIGAAECMPRATEAAQTTELRMKALAAFVVGVVAIGLVLLNHEHCVAGGGGHDHAH